MEYTGKTDVALEALPESEMETLTPEKIGEIPEAADGQPAHLWAAKQTADRLQAAEQMLADDARVCKATGTKIPHEGRSILEQCGAARIWPGLDDPRESIIRAFRVMDDLKPQNAIQARYAVQMAAVNDAALTFLGRAVKVGEPIGVVNANVGHAARLMRLFIQQTEMWQKLRGNALPVSVDQVHIHDGGQAIVGSVNVTKKKAKRLSHEEAK